MIYIFYEQLNSDKYKMQPKTCQELWKKCRILCSTINPLDRIKYYAKGCCIMSPIPNTDSFKPLYEPLFSSRTSFSYYQNKIAVVIIKRMVKCNCFTVLFPRIKDVHVWNLMVFKKNVVIQIARITGSVQPNHYHCVYQLWVGKNIMKKFNKFLQLSINIYLYIFLIRF